MPISNSCIHADANALIGAATTRQLAQVSGLFTENSTYSVACIAALPSAGLNKGRMIFVNDISAYRYSDGESWSNCYDTTVVISNPLYSWGDNRCGRLGVNDSICYSSPVREITSSTNWYKVSASSVNTHGIKNDGTLWSSGHGFYGNLADGDGDISGRRSSPVQEITSSTNWCALTQKAAIKTDSTLWGWGENSYGNLGDNTVINKSSPVREITSSSWSYVCGDNSRNIAIKTDSSLWFWGRSERGEAATGVYSCNYSSPVQEISSSTNWCKAATSRYSSLAINTSGELYGSGEALAPQCCSFTRELCSSTNWCDIAAGSNVGFGLKTDGTLWSWGTNGNGLAGTGTSSGTVRCPIQEITSSTNWCHINSGYASAAGIKTDGTLWSWGWNNYGTIGDGTIINRSSPVQEITSSTAWCFSSTHTSTLAIKQEVKGFNEP